MSHRDRDSIDFFIIVAIVLFGALLGLLALGGCLQEAPDDAPCSADDRIGMFVMSWTEVDGDCGDLPSVVVTVHDTADLPEGCTLAIMDAWRSASCELARSYSCYAQDGSIATYTDVTLGTNELDADTFEGTANVSKDVCDETDGCVSCSSRYDVTFDRV